MTKKILLFLIAITAMPLQTIAAEGDLLVRARAITINPAEKSTLPLGVDNQIVPELDFTYFLTNNFALELILGTSRHGVSLSGASIGKTSLLPPTLTLQYHLIPDGKIRPYIGAGLNYTLFYDVSLTAPLDLKKSSFGGALQAGVDIDVGDNLFINIDVKQIYIKTDVLSSGAKIDTLKINPLVAGIGLGMRF